MAADDASVREWIHALAEPTSAQAVLDIGCGTGADLAGLRRLTAPGTRLVGVDSSGEKLEAARAALPHDPGLELCRHDVATGLPFEASSFDRAISVNLLECVPDKLALLAEVHRVLQPDGKVVFAHWDWDSVLVDGEDKGRVRRIVHAFADWKQKWMADADGWMGRRLWRTFQRSGLFTGEVHAFVHSSTRYEAGTYGWEHIQILASLGRRGLVPEADAAAFTADVEALARDDQYFFSLTMYAYVGSPVKAR